MRGHCRGCHIASVAAVSTEEEGSRNLPELVAFDWSQVLPYHKQEPCLHSHGGVEDTGFA